MAKNEKQRRSVKERISRRQFLKIMGISAAASVTWKLGVTTGELSLIEVSESRVLMGTVVNLTVIGKDKDAAAAAVSATLEQMAKLEATLSRHQPDSELSKLNRDGHLDNASQPLLDLIAQSRQISDISKGAFDITIKPLIDLYQDYQKQNLLPPETLVAETLQLINYQNIQINDQTIAFAKQGMGITLDGIGKGYIVDAGTAVLREHGYRNVLVEAGGDLMASGKKNANQPWQVGLQNPRSQANQLLAKFSLNNQAAATSGDYMQPFTADMRQHHILDPRTGYSAPELASVTIKAPSAMLADGFATAVAVLGSQAGLETLDKLPHAEGYLVKKNMQIVETEKFSEA